MEMKGPILFEKYPNLKGKVPWISILNNVPTPVERLIDLEKELGLDGAEIYIKRDDKDHDVYGGNKLRKFEFIFGEAIKKKKKGIITLGGIGTNHGIACAIVTKQLGLKCTLFLSHQPLTWHVQRSLLLYDHFGAELHLSKSFEASILKSLIYRLFHPKYYLMGIGGTPLFGIGTSLGTVGFINAMIELKDQIDQEILPEPDAIFVAGGSTGTGAGLLAGCKLLGLKTEVKIVNVSRNIVVNDTAAIRNANKAIALLRKQDNSIPNVKIVENDFEIIEGYLGSNYGFKTKKGQAAVDLVMETEGKKRGFKLETTYTGKAMAAMLDYLRDPKNKSKKVLFWNTYNSNDLDKYLKETGFDYKKLPKKFHQFYEAKLFQCWQVVDCPKELRQSCPAYLNHEYRFWKVAKCKLSEDKKNLAKKTITDVIELEEA
ncbi:MAG: pyridoxal-phosphate dependent enzyme [Promethearchaeota archaeon]|nr:MAG: pyridoxal-phosphate dependent enzyme [Candidatus Lokiarchaeota archaeon]